MYKIGEERKVSQKVMTEQETRQRLIKHAQLVGCEYEMRELFKKADSLMRNCKNDQERKDMGKYFSTEVYRLLGGGGELFVDGQLVAKG